MIHTVRIDDTTRNGKKIVADLRRYRKGVEFENPAHTGVTPEGYMTADEFVKETDKIIMHRFNEYGLL